MIGTPIRGTLWHVYFQHLPLDPAPSLQPLAPVTGECFVVSADPSGSDLYEVARAAVLNGKARADLEFSLVLTKRLSEVKGTAIAAGGTGGAN